MTGDAVDRRFHLAANRGETAVLGIVLLIGIVAVSSVGILLVADQATTELSQRSETDRVEGGFVELSQEMAATASHSDVSRSIDLDVGEHGAVTKRDTGSIRIESSGLDRALDLPVGSIEYEGENARIAYQAGGVWRETEHGTYMVSAPPIHYDADSETFTFPVVSVGGERTLDTGSVGMTHRATTTYEDATVVENDGATVTVQSEFYRGWQAYFERQAGGAVVRDVDPANETVTIRLGHLELEEAFDQGIVVSERFDDFENANVDGEVVEGSMPELDGVIPDLIADARAGRIEPGVDVETSAVIDGSDGPIENGTYFTEELRVDRDLTIDLANGNVTIIVDGNVTATEELAVTNYDAGATNATAKIYATGDLEVDGGGLCVDGCDVHTATEPLQVYGTSDMHVGFYGGSPTFHGTLYAPSEEPLGTVDNRAFGPNGQCREQACTIGNADIYGAIVTASTNIHSAATSFTYDSSLEDFVPNMYPAGYELPPKLTYLNLAHHEVDVENR